MLVTTPTPHALVEDARFGALRDYVISSTGLCFYATRADALAGHVAIRLDKHGMRHCDDYLRLLQDNGAGEEELDQLIELLTIGETYFFRHRQLFDGLRDTALPEIAARNHKTRRLRIWSAGCSIGAEPYSLAILLRRDLKQLFDGWNISILATDFNRRFLSQAAAGRFEEWAFRGMPEELRRECFRGEDKSWTILSEYQECVSFQYHNLVRHPFPSLVHNLLAFDLILCRNVLIYFGDNIVERIVSQLTECLVPEGWLAIGHAEHNARLLRELELVDCRGASLYRRPAGQRLPGSQAPQIEPPCAGAGGAIALPFGEQPFPSKDIQFLEAVPPRPAAATKRTSPTKSKRAATPALSSEICQIRALADAGNVETGLHRCEALIRRHPLVPESHFYLALLLVQLSAHEAAVHSLERALYLDREHVLAHYYLGLTRQKLGQIGESHKAFRNVLQLLAGRAPHETLADADGLTISDIGELTRMHMETLNRP